MTPSEALSQGAEVTVLGLCIVFAVLILLMFVMMGMKKIFYKGEPGAETTNTPQVAPTVTPTPVAKKNNIDEAELIAVLTAAVAASLNTSTYNLNVKSFRKLNNTSPNWNKAGVTEVIDSRF
ncbi:MAG: OadG family protein [Oscillospiraceae bacterium]